MTESLPEPRAWVRRIGMFDPWLPPAFSVVLSIVLLWFGGFSTCSARRSALIAAGGALTACMGVMAIARPVIRAGGYRHWLEKSKIIDGGTLDPPTPGELREANQERNDALSVNIVGPLLVVLGTLINGFSGLLAS